MSLSERSSGDHEVVEVEEVEEVEEDGIEDDEEEDDWSDEGDESAIDDAENDDWPQSDKESGQLIFISRKPPKLTSHQSLLTLQIATSQSSFGSDQFDTSSPNGSAVANMLPQTSPPEQAVSVSTPEIPEAITKRKLDRQILEELLKPERKAQKVQMKDEHVDPPWDGGARGGSGYNSMGW